MTTKVRPPAVAGMFYPDDPDDLRRQLASSFADAVPAGVAPDEPPKALIAPHAGYVYSGPVAASGYERVRALRGVVTRVVLAGPSHRVPFEGVAVPSVDALETPFGLVPVDIEAKAAVLRVPGVVEWDAPHDHEHSVEVHLPFLQAVFGDVAVLPLVVGHAPAELMAAVFEAVWGGPETLIVVSTDLSHYHDHDTATELDAATAAAVEAGHWREVHDVDACGAYPLRGLLLAADHHQLRARVIDLRNSGDTAGPRDRVVGYGAFVLERQRAHTTEDEQLLDLAFSAIDDALDGRAPQPPDPAALSPALQRRVGVFVTVLVDGELNGCVGTLHPVEPLGAAVPRLAVDAAFADPRLPPLTAADLPGLGIKISLLGPLEPVPASSEDELVDVLRPGVDGVLLTTAGHQATFLPAVWDKVPDPREFIWQLEHKAGLRPGRLPSGARVFRYSAREIARGPGL